MDAVRTPLKLEPVKTGAAPGSMSLSGPWAQRRLPLSPSSPEAPPTLLHTTPPPTPPPPYHSTPPSPPPMPTSPPPIIGGEGTHSPYSMTVLTNDLTSSHRSNRPHPPPIHPTTSPIWYHAGEGENTSIAAEVAAATIRESVERRARHAAKRWAPAGGLGCLVLRRCRWRHCGGDIAIPAGVKAVWDLGQAYRDTTATRERIAINGLWRWQPADESRKTVPDDNWGYCKVPEHWSSSTVRPSIRIQPGKVHPQP